MRQVALKVKNPQKPKSAFNGKFLVDSGTTYTVVSEDILKKLGIKPKWEEEFSLADGRIIKRWIGNALYEFEGRESAAPVLFGEKDDSLLLGTFTRKLYKAILRM